MDLEKESPKKTRIKVDNKCLECNLFNKSMPHYKVFRCKCSRTCPGIVFNGEQKSKILKSLTSKLNRRKKQWKD